MKRSYINRFIDMFILDIIYFHVKSAHAISLNLSFESSSALFSLIRKPVDGISYRKSHVEL